MVTVSYIPLRQVLTAMRPFVGASEDEGDPAICLVRELQKHDERCGLNETIAVSSDHLRLVLDDLKKRDLIGENNPARILFDEYNAQV